MRWSIDRATGAAWPNAIDGQTAITVADALQNFMRTGLIGDDFHTRTRLVGEREV